METWTKMILDSFDKIATVEKKLAAKKLEVTKRKEVLETTLNTELAKKKDETKIGLLDTKISTVIADIDKRVQYYKNEITNAQTRRDEQVMVATKKCQDAIQKAQEIFDAAKRMAEMHLENTTTRVEGQFETYRQYCQAAIDQSLEKRQVVLAPYEKKKELLQQTSERTEDDDKVLVRLKIEEQQLGEELEKAIEEKRSYELLQTEFLASQRKAAEERNMKELKAAQEEQRKRDLAYYNEQKAIVEQDTKERRERNRIRWEDEQREKEEKERRKEEKVQNLKRFKTTIFPHLTPDETVTYDRLYKESSDLYQELLTLEDYPGVKDFLSMHKPDIEKIIEFEEREYPKLTQKEKDAYDNLADYDVKMKILRVKEKTKRREMLKKL